MNKKVAVLILLGLLAGRAAADEVIVGATEEPITIEEQEVVLEEEIEKEEEIILEEENEIDAILSQSRSVYIDAIVNGYDVILQAHLQNYENVEYSLQWQVSKDNNSWQDIPGAHGLTYSLTVNKENYSNYYRIAVTITGVKVAD